MHLPSMSRKFVVVQEVCRFLPQKNEFDSNRAIYNTNTEYVCIVDCRMDSGTTKMRPKVTLFQVLLIKKYSNTGR